MTNKEIDVRPIPPFQRHPMIFDMFFSLAAGESMALINDHDPKPLYYQFAAEYPGQFEWSYVESGPTVWKVYIKRT